MSETIRSVTYFLTKQYLSENFINFNINKNVMRKLLAKIKALTNGGLSLDIIDKTPVSRSPGDVTDISHN